MLQCAAARDIALLGFEISLEASQLSNIENVDDALDCYCAKSLCKSLMAAEAQYLEPFNPAFLKWVMYTCSKESEEGVGKGEIKV